MYLSEIPGPRFGTRQSAIDGHKEISRRCRAMGVDTLVVFDTHWLVNANYHINCAPHFKGSYTSNELPHFISHMAFESPGNPELGHLLAKVANAHGIETLAHDNTTLDPEYGTLGAAALHERRPALQGGLGLGAVHGALPERQRPLGLGHARGGRKTLRRQGGVFGQRLAQSPLCTKRFGPRICPQNLEPIS